MANKVKMGLYIDEKLREEFTLACEGAGMKPTTALELFMLQTVRSGKLSFDIPTASTIHYAMVNLAEKED